MNKHTKNNVSIYELENLRPSRYSHGPPISDIPYPPLTWRNSRRKVFALNTMFLDTRPSYKTSRFTHILTFYQSGSLQVDMVKMVPPIQHLSKSKMWSTMSLIFLNDGVKKMSRKYFEINILGIKCHFFSCKFIWTLTLSHQTLTCKTCLHELTCGPH